MWVAMSTPRDVADLTTGPERLDRRLEQLHRSADYLLAQAGEALEGSRADLACDALIRRSAVLARIADLTRDGPTRPRPGTPRRR
jgi:phage shock protein A